MIILNVIICTVHLLQYMIPPPPVLSPKKTYVMVFTHVMMLAGVMVLACVMVLDSVMSSLAGSYIQKN